VPAAKPRVYRHARAMLRAGKARSRLSLAIERKALAKATRTAVLTGQTPHAAQETTFFFHGL